MIAKPLIGDVRVWDRYGEQITERLRFKYAEQQIRAQLELFPFNDEIPF